MLEVQDRSATSSAQADDASRLAALEASLAERERQLEEASRLAHLGSWHWRLAEDIVTWSPGVFRAFGLDPSGPQPRHADIEAFHTAESYARLIAAIARARTYAEPYAMDVEIHLPDGSPRWLFIRGEIAAVSPNGQVTELRGNVQDITERKLVELALAHRERQLRETQRIARLGNWRWDRTTDTTTWSEEVYRVFGLDPAQPAPGYDVIREFHSPSSRALLEASVARAMVDGTPYEHDIELHLPDGSNRWIIARGEVESFHDGQPVVLSGTIQDITERKRTEQQVARSEALHRSVLESITDGLAVLDANWTYTYFSEQGARILNVRAEDVVGQNFWKLFPHAEETRFGSAYRQAVDTSKPVHFDDFYPDPLNKWVECHCYPSAEGLSVYFRDITEQRLAEAAVRETRSRFDLLSQSNLFGLCFPDRFGAFYDGNEEFLRIVGYTRQELEAGLVRWDTMTPSRYAQLDATHMEEAARLGRCTPYEKEYIRKDGTLVPILCGYALLEGSSDNYIGFILDISARKQAESAIREREQRFSVLADTIPQLVWMSDPAGNKIYANRTFLDYAGHSDAQVAGLRWDTLVDPEDLDRFADLRSHALLHGHPFLAEYRIRRHDGVFRTFLVRAVPVRNDAGDIERWLGSATDIHDRKLAEESLRRSEKLAATGRLAASIAHEINNPLEAVTNSLYLALMDRNLDLETRYYLELAEQELKRVAQVTTQTLRFHRQSVAPAEADLGDLMDSAFALFAPRFVAASISVDRDYTPGRLLFCRGDEVRQVFTNFLSNALDATRHGGRIRIRIRPSTDCGRAACPGLRVTVADTGHGIPAHLQKTIFEPFISTKDTTGTGLGLWVSDGIVQKHKGHISLRSRTDGPQHGTVFSLFLPFNGIQTS